MKTSDVFEREIRTGQLAQRLAHEPGLDADERVAHLALDLRPRHERRDRVDDDDVDAARADEGLGDLERLLAGVRLADEQLVDVDAAGPRVARVEGVLDVDERGDAAALLGLGDDVLADGRLARRLGAEDLGDPTARDAADAERQVEGDRAGRDEVDLLAGSRAELHDRAGTELLLDREDRRVHGLATLRLGAIGDPVAALLAVPLVRGPLPGHRHLVTLLSPQLDLPTGRAIGLGRGISPRRSPPRPASASAASG